jgi:hypothetical protein
MLNRVIVFILLACVISTYFSRDFAIATFELNQKYIAEKLCENKDKPWMNCNGRCYLMNKVKQAEENERKQASKDLRTNLHITWCINFSAPVQKSSINTAVPKRFRNDYSYAYLSQYITSIFRPPKSLITV